MNETLRYALIILFCSALGLVAVLANRLTERVKVPVALLVLVGAAVAVNLVPEIQPPAERTVERVLTVALVLVLFEGGMHIGQKRFREAAAPILSVGVIGTFLTARRRDADAALRMWSRLVPSGAGGYGGGSHRSGRRLLRPGQT